MITIAQIKRVSGAVLVFFLVSQISITPSYAADATQDPTTGTPVPVVNLTTPTSPDSSQDSSQESPPQTKTSTQFLSEPGVLSSSSLPPVPTGWTRANSNSDFAFRVFQYRINVNPRSSVIIEHLNLMDLRTGQTQVLATGKVLPGKESIFKVYDVSPDGEYVVFSTAPLITRIQKVNDPNTNRSFIVGLKKITWTTLAGGDPGVLLYDRDPNWILLVNPRTFQGVSGNRARHNSNFSFFTMNNEIYLLDRQNNEMSFIATAKREESISLLDVDPSGRYALVSIHRRDTTATGYVDTGDVLNYDVVNKTVVQSDRIDPVTGTSLGLQTIQGRVGGYRFVDGLVLLNITTVTFDGHIFVTGSSGIILNLNAALLRHTEILGMTKIFLNSKVFTPQKDKLLFGGNLRSGDNRVGIYDLATGKIGVQTLSNYDFGGIKGVSPNGEYAIVASGVNAIYIVPIRDLNQSVKTVFISVPGSQNPNYAMVSARFVDETIAEITLQNGQKYWLEVVTGKVIPSLSSSLLGFYGGTLPKGVRITSLSEAKDASGKVIGYDLVVILNSSTKPDKIQNQLFMIRKVVAGQWLIQEVKEYSYLGRLMIRSVFVYSRFGRLRRIARYNHGILAPASKGILFSTILARPRSGSYIEARRNGVRTRLPISTPLYLVFQRGVAVY